MCTAEEHGIGLFGLTCTFPNASVATIKGPVWVALLKLLGKGGDKIMLELLLHCGVFIPIASGKNNFYQLSGE